MYSHISLLIQGAHKDKIDFWKHIPYYRTVFPEIVLSTYTEHIDSTLINLCSQHKIKLVHQTERTTLENKYNIGFQTLSTLRGLQECSHKYVLKHRTDERYSNIEKLLDLFGQDDRKWVSGGTIFGAKSYHPYHAADHLFIANREALLRTFSLTLANLYNGVYIRNSAGEPAAELTFTRNFIRANGEEPTMERHDELMTKYFNFLPDREMHPFLIRFNSSYGQVYTEIEHLPEYRNRFNTMADILSNQEMRV